MRDTRKEEPTGPRSSEPRERRVFGGREKVSLRGSYEEQKRNDGTVRRTRRIYLLWRLEPRQVRLRGRSQDKSLQIQGGARTVFHLESRSQVKIWIEKKIVCNAYGVALYQINHFFQDRAIENFGAATARSVGEEQSQ